MTVRVVIASDHGGYEMKTHLVGALGRLALDLAVTDLGCHSTESVDYPDIAHGLSRAILAGEHDLGILVCGSGVGMSIAANRHAGIRAALAADPYTARMCREHNDANVLCLGGRVLGPALAEEIVGAFLLGRFEGGRHQRRIDQIELK